MVWIFVALIVVFISIIFLLLHLRIRIQYCYHKAVNEVIIYVYLVRIKVFHKKINLRGHAHDEHSAFKNILSDVEQAWQEIGFRQMAQEIVGQLKSTKNIFLFLLRKITFQELKWKTYFGTGEASSTGIATGGIWMAKATLVGAVYELSNMSCEPQINIIPYFQQKGFHTEIDCIVTIRLGKAIHTAMHLIRNFSSHEEAYS